MNKISLSFFFSLFFLICVSSCSSKSVTPEMFGAVGDGVHNDAVAFNQCIKSGSPIKLTPGKTYKFDTPLNVIGNEVFKIDGNGARIIISKDYPVTSAMAIFVFSMDVMPELMEIKNVSFLCQLEEKEKKIPNAGDTYLFLSKKCDKVVFENVAFKAEKKHSNVTFFRSEGGDLYMNKCDIVLNTNSRIGGIFWLMNKSHIKSKVEICNSSFEYETKDECMCFATATDCVLPQSDIEVYLDNCKFKSAAMMSSSGFMIVYSRSLNTVSNINVTYNKCKFECSGTYPRYIQTYQCGGERYNFGSFNTKFKKCTFDFSKDKFDEWSEGGLVGLIYENDNQMHRDQVGYSFEDCVFNLHDIAPIVGDKDASRRGYFKFSNCIINSNRRAFQKKYNEKTCDISLDLKDCIVKSLDESLTFKQININTCTFYNSNKKVRPLDKKKENNFDKVVIGK